MKSHVADVAEPSSSARAEPSSSTGVEPSSSTGVEGQGAARVLVVDDHHDARVSMCEVLEADGHQVDSCGSGHQACEMLAERDYDVVVTDMNMPGMTGLELVERVRDMAVSARVVMVTAHASIKTAVQAIRGGALDYIEKPFTADQLESLVRKAFSSRAAHANAVDGVLTVTNCGTGDSPRNLSADHLVTDSSDATHAMVGSSRVMQQLRDTITQVAATDATVLISGESGVGKELVAQAIHRASPRAEHALVSVNCPAMSPQLMESELFGHQRGAFTSADQERIGRFELAEGGSLLLDEITEIELPLQAKLLRVLQERCYERVGSSQSVAADVRVLATTNCDLRIEVQERRFREDLFFRLAVVPIEVPPLRQRREDVAEIATHFLRVAAQRQGSAERKLSDCAQDLLLNYSWPGNVRELENLMTRAQVLCSAQELTADLLRPWLLATTSESNTQEITPGMSLQEMERQLIEATLAKHHGHREQTAQALGIGVRTLANKLKSYGYQPRASFSVGARKAA